MGVRRASAGVLAAVGLLAAPTAALAGDATFTEATGSPLSAGNRAFVPVVADFNNDGDQDIATVNAQAPSVTVDLGGAGASFTAAPLVSLPQSGIDIETSDFNDDGNSDLVVASGFGDAVYVLRGNGDGTFTAQTPVSVPGAGALAVGDWNNDRKPDIAVTGDDPGGGIFESAMYSFVYTSGFAFQSLQSPTSLGGLGLSMTTGDFDNDGAEDLAVGANETLWTFRNQNGTNLIGSPHFDVDVLIGGLEAGDFDGDGDEDLVTTGDQSRTLRGTAGMGFEPGALVGGQPNGASVGDFNSDGDLDLALSYHGSNPDRSVFAVFAGGTGASFAQVGPLYGTVTGNAGDTAVGDFDGDGNQDVVLANSAAGSISIFTGGGTPWSAGNLLAFGGVEGVAGKLGGSTTAPAPWVSGSPSLRLFRYGTRMGPSFAVAQRWEGGSNFLGGGFSNQNSSYTQTVDVTQFASAIDAKQATANLSARLGGYSSQIDSMGVTATFKAGDGTELGSFKVGPVTATNRGNRTTMLRRALSQAIPAQTRSIVVRLDATQPSNNDFLSYGTADNIRLFIATPSNPDPTVPSDPSDPSTPAGDTTPPQTEIDKAPKRRTEKSKAKIRYSADEPATFQCAIKGSKPELREFTDCGETKAKYKRLKPGKKKFRVRAIDAAGNVDATPAIAKWKVLK